MFKRIADGWRAIVFQTLFTVTTAFGGGFIAIGLILAAHYIAGSLGLIPPIFPQIHIVGVM